MIFIIIVLFISLAVFVFSIIKEINNDRDLYFCIAITSAIFIIIFLLALISGIIDCSELNAKLIQMRLNPQNFSIQDASSVNEKLVKIIHWKNTIFSFYKNIDTTLLDLSKFVNI